VPRVGRATAEHVAHGSLLRCAEQQALAGADHGIETPAGSDYTGADCQDWMRQAGFRDTYARTLAGPDSMIVGIK